MVANVIIMVTGSGKGKGVSLRRLQNVIVVAVGLILCVQMKVIIRFLHPTVIVNDVGGDGHPLPCAVKTNPTPIILMSLGR